MATTNVATNNMAAVMANQNLSIINPKNFDPRIKTQLINQNIFHSGHGNYKICPITGSIKFPYKNNYNPGTIDNLCKVIVHDKHPIEIANSLSDHGLDSLTHRKPIPAIMYPVGKEFLGTNFESREGIYDENIILRTNYPYIIKKQSDLFNRKDNDNNHFIVYSNPITVIRDQNYNPLQFDNVFKVGIITVCFERKNELITDKITEGEKFRENNILTSSDLLNFQIQIETVFQAAICGFHEILILSLFDREFGIPLDDQVLIYNICILKYCHKFKAILICIPSYQGKDIFEYFDQSIVKPHNMTNDIEMKYKAEEMAQRITNEDSDKTKQKKESIITNDMNEDEKMKVLKKTK
jgi:hypothetical protein